MKKITNIDETIQCEICNKPAIKTIEVGASDFDVCSEECESVVWDRYGDWLNSEAN